MKFPKKKSSINNNIAAAFTLYEIAINGEKETIGH